jgi:uncharacterized membrane protein
MFTVGATGLAFSLAGILVHSLSRFFFIVDSLASDLLALDYRWQMGHVTKICMHVYSVLESFETESIQYMVTLLCI